MSERSCNESVGGEVGVAIDVSGGGSVGVTVGANYGKGKAGGDEVAYRNSHIGSGTGKTTINAGEKLSINGGQVSGKGVKIAANDLEITSMQDTATYNSKQQQGSVDVTIGYGFSGSVSASKSKINADYASVNEQSGIFAGDDGYQINIKNHTDLKGGLVTSTQKAELDGKNSFATGTLKFEDLANKSEYKGEAIGLGVSGSVKGENPNQNSRIYTVDKSGMSNSMGYGKESDSQHSTTHAGINTNNTVIRDSEKQQQITGKTAEETKNAVKTNVTLENYAQNAGYLANNFDKEQVQNEIDLQVKVTQESAPLIAQGVATASDYLGKVKQYENKLLQKDLLERAISQSNNPQEVERLNQALNELDSYLIENKAKYDLFKEGGIGRAGLHVVGGGILTGDISGVAGAGVTSLSAPIIAQVADNSGNLKPVVDTVGGLAIGYATGGTAGAFTGSNADWNNRQLHDKEVKKIKDIAKKYAKEQGISVEQAEQELMAQAMRDIDEQYANAHAIPDQQAEKFLRKNAGTFVDENGDRMLMFVNMGYYKDSTKYAEQKGYTEERQRLSLLNNQYTAEQRKADIYNSTPAGLLWGNSINYSGSLGIGVTASNQYNGNGEWTNSMGRTIGLGGEIYGSHDLVSKNTRPDGRYLEACAGLAVLVGGAGCVGYSWSGHNFYANGKVGVGIIGKFGITDGWQETTKYDPNAVKAPTTPTIHIPNANINYIYDQMGGM